VLNRAIGALARLGVGPSHIWLLEVRGRRSGRIRVTPVDLLSERERLYLVAPRGNTQWARNLRASGEGRLLLGRRAEPFRAVEILDEGELPSRGATLLSDSRRLTGRGLRAARLALSRLRAPAVAREISSARVSSGKYRPRQF